MFFTKSIYMRNSHSVIPRWFIWTWPSISFTIFTIFTIRHFHFLPLIYFIIWWFNLYHHQRLLRKNHSPILLIFPALFWVLPTTTISYVVYFFQLTGIKESDREILFLMYRVMKVLRKNEQISHINFSPPYKNDSFIYTTIEDRHSKGKRAWKGN